MMKEQRSLSVGSLPGNLKSHILKTIQFDHLTKGVRDQPPADVYSDSLNKIRELPEEYDLPKHNKAYTQQDKSEKQDDERSIPIEASMEDSHSNDDTDPRFDQDDELGHAMDKKST